MVPAHPPLPTAWNFPFQRDEGSQISTLISESIDGVSVAATRQNAGSDAYARGTCGGAPPCRATPGRTAPEARDINCFMCHLNRTTEPRASAPPRRDREPSCPPQRTRGRRLEGRETCSRSEHARV